MTSLMRALHSKLNPHPLIDDRWGDVLVPEAQRARFDPDSLLRSPAFPIDHPATQNLKLRRIHGCGLSLPASVHFVAADLAKQSVAEALAASSFDSRQQAFFSWLGVTMYLTRAANLSTMRSVAKCSRPGSELVFTYMDAARLRAPSPAFQEMQMRVTAMGEPFVSGFDPDSLAAEIAHCGLELLEDLSGGQVVTRYGRSDDASLSRPSSSHVALARVMHPRPQGGGGLDG